MELDGTVAAIDSDGGRTVERVEPFDFEALTREFAERDRNGTGGANAAPPPASY